MIDIICLQVMVLMLTYLKVLTAEWKIQVFSFEFMNTSSDLSEEVSCGRSGRATGGPPSL